MAKIAIRVSSGIVSVNLRIHPNHDFYRSSKIVDFERKKPQIKILKIRGIQPSYGNFW